MTIEELLEYARSRGATDIHVSAATPVSLRIGHDLVPVTTEPLTAEQSCELSLALLSEEQRTQFAKNLDIDFMASDQDGRYRINVATSVAR